MTSPTATCLIRSLPHYRREAFQTALQRLGYQVAFTTNLKPRPNDLLLIWNRYGQFDQQAKLHERAGAAVIVVENGYLPMRDVKKTFAMSLNQHNGAGRWPKDPGRANILDIAIKPWRYDGGDILLLPQRGIGPTGLAMPRSWLASVQTSLKRLTGRPVRVRQHPGTQRRVTPLESDLDGVHCCVTWGSGAGLKALCAGIPVIHELPCWIGGKAASCGLKWLEDPLRGDRLAMLGDVASAQWSVEEVLTGEPIKQLVDIHQHGENKA